MSIESSKSKVMKTTATTQKPATKVVFRKFKDGQIIALFPELKERGGMVDSYMHIGQHGSADPFIVHDTKPATADEYRPLADELTAIGYRLDIRRNMRAYYHYRASN